MKRRILLVDDDTAVLLTLKAVLEMNQFEVDTASSAVEAVEKMRSGIYQMVITDARMETDDAGFHVIRAAREQAYNPATALLTAGFHVIRAAREQSYNPATALLTAYPPLDGDWRHRGSSSVLVKPVGTEDLLRQIEALLVTHEDAKHLPRHTEEGMRASAFNREGGRKAS